MADGMSFRGCLSGGGDIFSKSVEKQGGANRTFATGGRCHGWQLEPCPCGLEPLLTFRQKIPTGRPYIEEGHSIRHGRSWICFTNSQFIILLVHTDNAGNFPHDGIAEIVVITDLVKERHFNDAIRIMEGMSVVREISGIIRVY